MTQTAEVPVLTARELDMSAQELRAHALHFYAAELNDGRDPSAYALAARYGKTDRWARGIRSTVHAERGTETTTADTGTPAGQAEHAPETPTTLSTSADAGQGTEPLMGLPAETIPVPAYAATETGNADRGSEEQVQNPAPFAQNPVLDAPTGDLRPSAHLAGAGATEPDEAAPSWTVQDHAAGLAPETLGPPTVAVPVPTPVPAQVAERLVETPERQPEATETAGTVEVVAVPAAETPAERDAGGGVPGRAVAWVAFATGVAASVAANILHAHDAPGGADAAELVGAAFWPVALLLCVEMLTRVAWPRGFWWGFGRYAGVGLVGLVAAVLSYRHMAGLLKMWGEDKFNAHLGPLAVDGLMLVAATALLAITHRQKEPQP